MDRKLDQHLACFGLVEAESLEARFEREKRIQAGRFRRESAGFRVVRVKR